MVCCFWILYSRVLPKGSPFDLHECEHCLAKKSILPQDCLGERVPNFLPKPAHSRNSAFWMISGPAEGILFPRKLPKPLRCHSQNSAFKMDRILFQVPLHLDHQACTSSHQKISPVIILKLKNLPWWGKSLGPWFIFLLVIFSERWSEFHTVVHRADMSNADCSG